MEVTRRQVLGAAVAGASTVGLAACGVAEGGHPVPVDIDPALAASARASGAPNLIVILSDDHRADHLAAAGVVPFLQTPVLDALAADGLDFTHAYCTTSLCSPSRASFLTGEYASRHGVRNNISTWDPAAISVFDGLAAAGYRNAFIGKWHMPGSLPDLRGVERFITFTAEEGQGVYYDCPLIIDGVETPRPGTYVTTDLTDYAIEWLGTQSADQPFCLYLAHKAVHHQFEPPPDLLGTYDAVTLDLPPESFTLQTLLDRNVWEGTAGRLETAYRRYCETLLGLDREIGRLLDYLASRGIADNTAVFYTSDNGYSWGEHVLTGKRWAYDENIRLPFIVRWPDGIPDPGSTRPQPILNIDLAPTMLNLAGAPIPASMQGASLVPLLKDEPTQWREEVFYEYFEDFPYQVPPSQAVRTSDWLYVEYARGLPPELYDLRADPQEQANLAEDPAYAAKRSELSARLAELRQEYT
ncbi:MAG: sulfatase-like hydrolase/transferase [Candidatus Nanopelagicales bacterium]